MRRRTDDDKATAFEGVVRSNQRVVWVLALRMMGRPAAAEDALQDALVKAFRGFGKVRDAEPGAQRAWLCTIVYHVCVDHLRVDRRINRGRVHMDPSVMDASASQAGGEVGLALAGVPLELRAPLVLVYVVGLDYATAADVLGVPTGTLSSRLARGKAALRRQLGEPIGRRAVR